ncbi:DUF2711 domain-containing protein [Bacillus inaquosorum]|uniref:DUF2711 domain-containing protein n=1 Tax=Bacillus inaquosorum TaxID=483913 RepID=A0A9Q4HVJ6_9BACI|nr:DUF2711 domain-containing protein [Bacillus inaquosorum]MCY7787749.1 DUF2711 domain-containing protein [Bacillus inaquosorum]MCY7820422.1 DUF2711 domain-containing protein [Bacillus inaquosorum]MCY7940319.1 DUF2711 domain-containing protein [Bacillus inaquosorum]MCY8083429.1 DUF2711 domain-containing protein [Bacillus inaquosorum]MCY8172990.1 DUF2711 domain-containing protein [Bacillus inaquosorum]
MLDYIWLEDESPILKQIPVEYTSAAILFSPFIQMPEGWEKAKRKNDYEHIFPNDEEIRDKGKAVSWKKVMSSCGFQTHAELALALMTSIGALRDECSRQDLAKLLHANIKEGLFYPSEDHISNFHIPGLVKVLGSNGSKRFYYSEPIVENSGFLDTTEANLQTILDEAAAELILTDKKMDFVFMSVYDSFINVFLAKDENINDLVQRMGWEAMICDESTYISWYR